MLYANEVCTETIKCCNLNSISHYNMQILLTGTLLGLTNAAATIPGFVGPQVVGALTSNVINIFTFSGGLLKQKMMNDLDYSLLNYFFQFLHKFIQSL